MKKIQVSTIAEKRDQYTQQFEENSKKEYTWIPRQPQVEFIEKFVNEFLTHSKASRAVFKHICFRQNGKFIAPKEGTIAIVFMQGGRGGDTTDYGWDSVWQRVGFIEPPGGINPNDNPFKEYRYGPYREYSNILNWVTLDGLQGNPSSFGDKMSVHGGLGSGKGATDKRQVQSIIGWKGKNSSWDWGDLKYTTTTRSFEQSLATKILILHGLVGEIKLGFFKLQPNEEVEVIVGSGGAVDVSYLQIEIGENNDITAHIPTIPNKPQNNAGNQGDTNTDSSQDNNEAANQDNTNTDSNQDNNQAENNQGNSNNGIQPPQDSNTNQDSHNPIPQEWIQTIPKSTDGFTMQGIGIDKQSILSLEKITMQVGETKTISVAASKEWQVFTNNFVNYDPNQFTSENITFIQNDDNVEIRAVQIGQAFLNFCIMDANNMGYDAYRVLFVEIV